MNSRKAKLVLFIIVVVGLIFALWIMFKENLAWYSPIPLDSEQPDPFKEVTFKENRSWYSPKPLDREQPDPFEEVKSSETNLFEASIKRHLKRKDKRLIYELPVAWTYQSYNVTSNLTCWSESKFASTFEENKKIVQQYPNGTSVPYLADLGLLQPYKSMAVPKLPVFVTGASSNHYLESQAMLRDFHNKILAKYNDVKLIYYDIGLSETERNQVKRYCRCEVRIFPFDKYPVHVRHLTGYTWKVLIIQIVLNEFGYAFWLDASMRFINMNLFSELELKVEKYGISSWDFGYSLAVTIDPDTYHFLREDPCLFVNKPSCGTGGILVKRSSFTLEYIMRPWVSCALTFGCMVNKRSKQMLKCPSFDPKDWTLGACQRYEQAVLSIILWRLYGRYDVVMFPKGFVESWRGDQFQYFSMLEQQNTSKINGTNG
ncbi:hypothetical protein CHS0354_009784 [Potamilus streckersoni]|uniref:Uncharacterized protein n=1 Tax=Potamilus streckersoni TaxID=2493646 RepID=A0AAE0W2E6_9BIVA|nr:hypothetical protein CHS0354_009784 [Potamilus streckersoni]